MVDLQKIRADFPALNQYVWFQNGGVSITPAPVAEAHMDLMRELLHRGPMHIVFPDEEYPRRERSMERLAAFFGVDRGELGLMRGVSEGFQTVLRGLQWQAGDQIVLTAEEEAALLLPYLHLRDLYGVEVVKVPLVEDVEEQVQAVADRLTDRTRLLAFSHVTTDTGFRLPAAEMCVLARERGVLSFVDMAHSAGLYPMSLRDVEIEHIKGGSNHRLMLEQTDHELKGIHYTLFHENRLSGRIEGTRITISSLHRFEGTNLFYQFAGTVDANAMEGTVQLGTSGQSAPGPLNQSEFGHGKWRARKCK